MSLNQNTHTKDKTTVTLPESVRLIAADGKTNLGTLCYHEAERLAYNDNLDLLPLNEKSVPPVYRIGDRGKMLYEKAKREREHRKHQIANERHIKEVKFRLNIDDHDYQIKLKNIIGFLKDKNRIRIQIRFQGREITHAEIGHKLAHRIVNDTKDYIGDVPPIRLDGRNINFELKA